ncbi:unnamed protein product, partial [Brachionus calyciflorus]
LNKSNFRLGGEKKIVEIDESLFIKLKHFKGKDLKRPQVWVFGMYERSSKKNLFFVVPKRDAFTLLNIIYEFILPDTMIYSDCWKAYSKIKDLDKRFEHKTVNHSLCFVNAEDGTHTNGITSVWCSGKIQIKMMRGVSRKYLTSYLDEFTWRRNIYEESELVNNFTKMNTYEDSEEEIFDVEDVDRTKIELTLYESASDQPKDIQQAASTRQFVASKLVSISSEPIN